MKRYITPSFEEITLESADVITASTLTFNNGLGEGDGVNFDLIFPDFSEQ